MKVSSGHEVTAFLLVRISSAGVWWTLLMEGSVEGSGDVQLALCM